MEVFINGMPLSEHKITSTTLKLCQHCGQFGENTLLLNNLTTCFCDECFYKMGMRLEGGVYFHTGEDQLFVNENANISSCPFYNAAFGKSTPYRFLKILEKDKKFCAAVNESICGSFYDSDQDTSYPYAGDLENGNETNVFEFFKRLTKTELKLLILQGSVWPPSSKKGKSALRRAFSP